MKKYSVILLLLLSPIFAISQDVPGKRGRFDTLKAFSTNYSQLDSQWFVSRNHFTRPQRFDSTVDFHQGLKYLNTYNITFPPQSGTFLLSPDSTLIRTFSDSLYGRKANTNIWSGVNYFTGDTTYFGLSDGSNNSTLKMWSSAAGSYQSITSGDGEFDFSNAIYVPDYISTTGSLSSATLTTTSNANIGGEIIGDTISSNLNNMIFSPDSLKIDGNFTGGHHTNYNIGRGSLVFGIGDSNYASSLTGQNYIFGNQNSVGRINNSIYGNWIFSQQLRSENIGLWAFGADDDFQKKIVPFEGHIVFVNEFVKHWGSNSMGLFGYMPLSYAIQSPHVKDTLMFAFRYLKGGNASDDTGYASLHYELHRRFTKTLLSNGETQKISSEGSSVKRIYSINQNDDDAWHFNTYNTSGRPFAPVYVDSSHMIVSAGYLDGDSLRRNGSTVLTGTYHSGLASSALGNITTGTVSANGRVSGTYFNSAGQLYFGTPASGNTSIQYGTAPYFVQKNNSESDGGIVLQDEQDTTQRGFMVYGSSDNLTKFGNSTVTSIQLDNSGNVILGSTSGAIYPNTTGAIDLGTAPTAGNKEWDSLYVQDIKASNTISSSGKISSGGLTSAGAFGVANIVDTVTYGAVSSTIASRNLPSTAGTYRISYFMGVQTAGTGGTVQMTVSYNNGIARTLTSASLNLTLTTEADNNVFVYKVTSGTPTVVVTVTGATGSPVYSFDAVVERLK